MIKTEEEFDLVRQQLNRAETALSVLRREVLPQSEQRFRLIAEAYVEQIHRLRAQVDEYLGLDLISSSTVHASLRSHGKPAAIVIGVEGEDLQDLLTRSSPEFWEMIERVRQEPTVSLHDAQKHFEAADAFEAAHGRPMTAAAAKKLVSSARKTARGTSTAARRRK